MKVKLEIIYKRTLPYMPLCSLSCVCKNIGDVPARQRPGFFAKRQNQVSPSEVHPRKSGTLRNTLRSRFSISARTGGGFAGSRGEDIEMQRSVDTNRVVPLQEKR